MKLVIEIKDEKIAKYLKMQDKEVIRDLKEIAAGEIVNVIETRFAKWQQYEKQKSCIHDYKLESRSSSDEDGNAYYGFYGERLEEVVYVCSKCESTKVEWVEE